MELTWFCSFLFSLSLKHDQWNFFSVYFLLTIFQLNTLSRFLSFFIPYDRDGQSRHFLCFHDKKNSPQKKLPLIYWHFSKAIKKVVRIKWLMDVYFYFYFCVWQRTMWMTEYVQRVLRWFYHHGMVFILFYFDSNDSFMCSSFMRGEKWRRTRKWFMKSKNERMIREKMRWSKRNQPLPKRTNKLPHVFWFIHNKYTRMVHKSQTKTQHTNTFTFSYATCRKWFALVIKLWLVFHVPARSKCTCLLAQMIEKHMLVELCWSGR